MEDRAKAPKFVRLPVAGLVFAVLVAIALAAFAWPAARLEPRELPLGVVAPASAAGALERRIAHGGDAFEMRRYADEAAARAAIENREVYGALVASADEVTLLTASAASPVVAQVLEEAFAPRAGVRVIDVVPSDPDDPRGAAFNSLLLPLTLVSTLTGLIVALVTRPGLVQVGGLAGAALVAAALAITIAHGWLAVLPGDWWANAGVLALLVLAIASLVAGLTAVLGVGGFVLAALLMIFVGNPFSGVATAPALLPEWAGLLGQLLPPGAGGSLLRSNAFFDGAGGAGPLTVLLAWIAFGLAAVAAGAFRPRGSSVLRGHPAARLLARPADRSAAHESGVEQLSN